MIAATTTVVAKIMFSRWPQGRSGGRRRSRASEPPEIDRDETNSVVPSALICFMRRCVASWESNEREIPFVGDVADASSSLRSCTAGFGGTGDAAAGAAGGLVVL